MIPAFVRLLKAHTLWHPVRSLELVQQQLETYHNSRPEHCMSTHTHTHVHTNVLYLSPNICLITPPSVVCHFTIYCATIILTNENIQPQACAPTQSHARCEYERLAHFVQFCMQSCHVKIVVFALTSRLRHHNYKACDCKLPCNYLPNIFLLFSGFLDIQRERELIGCSDVSIIRQLAERRRGHEIRTGLN